MKVLLLAPPGLERLEICQSIGVRAPPLGLAYIASILEHNGYKVKIIDSPTLDFDLRRVILEIKMFKPDIVGLTALTPTIYNAYEIAKYIKAIDKEVPIVVGGPHVTFMYKEVLSESVNIDITVIGEGEYTFLELLNVIGKHGLNPNLLKSVKGIAFRDNGKIYFTGYRRLIANLDSLPPPARHLLPMDRYTVFDKPVRVVHVIASRGCPYGCIYCSTSYFMGRLYRIRSVNSVLDEIEDVVYRYRVKNIVFVDDELTIIRKWMIDFLNGLKERRLDICFTCGSRVDHVDRELISRMYSQGCSIIYFGVESANQKTLDQIGKKITVQQIINAFKLVREVKGESAGSFILGLPWETIEDMRRTIAFASKLNPSYAQFTVATPYPGTPLYMLALKDNLIEDKNWSHYTTLIPVIRGYSFTREQVSKLLVQAYILFYFSPNRLFKEMESRRFKLITEMVMRILKPRHLQILKSTL
ncbi:MAG: radical SAM protein [Candidatus Methanomethylicia archaeon]